MANKTATNVDILLAAISDTQNTIRAYDFKAEILAALITLLIGFIAFFLGHDHHSAFKTTVESLIIASAFGTLFQLALVLYPSRKPINSILMGTYKPSGVFYLSPASIKSTTVDEMIQSIGKTDWLSELTFELVKISAIRERKMKWFTRALTMSFVMFVLVGIFCFATYIC